MGVCTLLEISSQEHSLDYQWFTHIQNVFGLITKFSRGGIRRRPNLVDLLDQATGLGQSESEQSTFGFGVIVSPTSYDSILVRY